MARGGERGRGVSGGKRREERGRVRVSGGERRGERGGQQRQDKEGKGDKEGKKGKVHTTRST